MSFVQRKPNAPQSLFSLSVVYQNTQIGEDVKLPSFAGEKEKQVYGRNSLDLKYFCSLLIADQVTVSD